MGWQLLPQILCKKSTVGWDRTLATHMIEGINYHYITMTYCYISYNIYIKRQEKNHIVLANDRSTPAIVRLENVRQSSTNVRWANDRPGLRTCALGVT
jgi:hypothetical protein